MGSWTRTLQRLVACVALGLAPAGCYFLQAAQGQLAINAAKRPIAAVVADPGTNPALRARLDSVAQMRRFATTALALPDNASFTSYVDVHRRYVVWNVFATPEFSTTPVTWCFPVAGCVAYRGYFSEQAARSYGLGLEARGLDVLVGGVPAYSTLGHFADPVLSTVLTWDDADLAGLLFHELAHQVAYAKDDSAFNEAFATAVEREGVRRYELATGKAPDVEASARRSAQRAALARLAVTARERLAAIYQAPLTAPARRAAKRESFATLRAEYDAGVAAGTLPAGYQRMFDNNAGLLAIATYEECVPGFERMLAAEGGDLERFYARVRALAAGPRAERHRALAGTSGSCR